MFTAETTQVDVSDGIIEYAEYGNPQGRPQLFFHGFIGSHFDALPAHRTAVQNDIRIIACNRPGVGKSTPDSAKTIVERIEKVKQLCAAINLEEFDVCGISGGVPYTLATAACMSDQVKSVTAVSGMGPIEEKRLLAQMNVERRIMLQLAQLPHLAEIILRMRMRPYTRGIGHMYEILLQRLSEDDRQLFTEIPELRPMFLGDIESTLGTGVGPTDLAKELRRYFHWGFSLRDIPEHIPVQFWHGTEDPVVPHCMSEHMATAIPQAQLTLRSGGHAMIAKYIDEILCQ